jgi:glycine oxidase
MPDLAINCDTFRWWAVSGSGGEQPSVLICGGGIVGLSIAWRAAQAGIHVRVVDPAPTSGASHAAAGLLSPVFEAHPGEEQLLALNLAAYDRWDPFAADLGATAAADLRFQTEGTLGVALTGDDARLLDDVRRFHDSLHLAVERLDGVGCRALEPTLSPRIRGGLRVATEASVDPRRVCAALLVAVERLGVELIPRQVAEVRTRGGRVDGVRLGDGSVLAADRVVVALGAWTASPGLLPAEVTPPVRPVKGQILRLRFDPARPPLVRNVHAWAHGLEVYLVPRADGELVIGATVEEKGFDTSVTGGGVGGLLEAAIEVVPEVAELPLVESIAGLRPGSADNAPVLGPTTVEGLTLATGHFRQGVLLAPITAEAITAHLVHGTLPAEAAPFTLARFR